jgi:hypothetical protein
MCVRQLPLRKMGLMDGDEVLGNLLMMPLSNTNSRVMGGDVICKSAIEKGYAWSVLG